MHGESTSELTCLAGVRINLRTQMTLTYDPLCQEETASHVNEPPDLFVKDLPLRQTLKFNGLF